MTQPGNPDPNSPQYGPPPPPSPGYGQSAPTGYGAPAPPPGYGQPQGYPSAPPAGYGASTPGRPGMVTAAAVLAFISGGLSLLGNLLVLGVDTSLLGLGGFIKVLAIVGLILAAGLIFGGVQALQGKSFVILLAVAGAAIVLNLIVMIGYFQVTSLLSLVIPILIIVFLLNPQSKAWITSRGGKTLG